MPRLYIEVMGGVVMNVYSNAATEVVLIDHDDLDSESNESDARLLDEYDKDKNSGGFAELKID
jgi:hypothetical protein